MKDHGSILSKTVLISIMLCLVAVCVLRVGLSQVSGDPVVRVQPSKTDVRVGDTFSVSVVIESVKNLYGLDVTLRWDSSVVQFQSVDLRLGVESHSGGVLHEDFGSLIYVADDNASETEYHLAATSVAPASSFDGSGTVFVVSFKAVGVGSSALALETELADHPLPGETANLIDHVVVSGSVESSEDGSGGSGDGDLFILFLIGIAVVVSVVAVVVVIYMRRR